MEFEEILNKIQPYIEVIQNQDKYWIGGIVFMSTFFYYLGKRVGKSNILISKQTRKQIEQFESQQDQKQKQRLQLQKDYQEIKRKIMLFVPLIIAIQFGIFYYNWLDEQKFIYSIICCVTLIVIGLLFLLFERKRIENIQQNLELSQKEVDNVMQELIFNLGNKVMAQIKKQLLTKEMLEINLKLQQEKQNIAQKVEQENKQKFEELKQKIKNLEDQQFNSKNFQRNNQQHKTEPTPVIVPKEINEKTQKYKQFAEYLQKENQIQKDMISKIINIEWCQDCVSQNIHCIQKYFEQAKIIGEEYQKNVQDLEQSKNNQVDK